MSATALWAAVVASYDSGTLISLTNINNPAATTINTTAGENAAQDVIDLWPVYAEVAYSASNATHVAVAKLGVIAMLWRRGGTATEAERIRWDEVFGRDGAISRVRLTSPRGHESPSSNSGVTQASELTSDGQRVRGWSDRESLPVGYLPSRIVAED